MRQKIIVIIGIISFPLFLHGQNSENIFLIESDKKVSSWIVGESVDNLMTKLPENWRVEIDSLDMCEGCFDYYKVYNIFFQNEYLLKIEPDWETRQLYRFWIGSKKFKTEKGFQIGMTVKRLKELYTIEEVYTAGDIGIAVIVEELNGSFIINPYSYKGDFYKLTKENLPDNLKIEEIIIVE